MLNIVFNTFENFMFIWLLHKIIMLILRLYKYKMFTVTTLIQEKDGLLMAFLLSYFLLS